MRSPLVATALLLGNLASAVPSPHDSYIQSDIHSKLHSAYHEAHHSAKDTKISGFLTATKTSSIAFPSKPTGIENHGSKDRPVETSPEVNSALPAGHKDNSLSSDGHSGSGHEDHGSGSSGADGSADGKIGKNGADTHGGSNSGIAKALAVGGGAGAVPVVAGSNSTSLYQNGTSNAAGPAVSGVTTSGATSSGSDEDDDEHTGSDSQSQAGAQAGSQGSGAPPSPSGSGAQAANAGGSPQSGKSGNGAQAGGNAPSCPTPTVTVTTAKTVTVTVQPTGGNGAGAPSPSSGPAQNPSEGSGAQADNGPAPPASSVAAPSSTPAAASAPSGEGSSSGAGSSDGDNSAAGAGNQDSAPPSSAAPPAASSPAQSSPASADAASTDTQSTNSQSGSSSSNSSTTPGSSGIAPTTGPAAFKTKRGIIASGSQQDALAAAASTGKISWLGNWYSGAPKTLPKTLSFVPQMYHVDSDSNGEWTRNVASALKGQFGDGKARYLLSFGEPAAAGGDKAVDPKGAVKAWGQYIEPYAKDGVKLGAPTTLQNKNDFAWLDEFLSQCTGCSIGFLAQHWFDKAAPLSRQVDAIKGTLAEARALAQKHGIEEVWLDNFSAEGTAEEQRAFLQEVVPWLEGQDWIKAYAYVPMEVAKAGAGGAFVDGNGPGLNDLGSFYANL